MRHQIFSSLLVSLLFLAGCSSGGSSNLSRVSNMHREITIVDPVTGLAAQSAQAQSGIVNAQLISIGSIYLESQVPPLEVGGTSLQASDVAIKDLNAYISYNEVDDADVKKIGAIEHMKPYICDLIGTLRVEYCLGVVTSLPFPTTDMFSSYSDGTNLYAVGSTLDESQYPYFGRLFKIPLDAGGSPTSVTQTVTLPSYAGTSVTGIGSRLYVTSGTSTDTAKMGGLSILKSSDLSSVKEHQLYDARAVASNKGNTSRVFVSRGKIDGANPGALVEYNADGTGAALRTIASGGNTIAESKSNLLIGDQLILASLGDQGFKVMCKGTGATLASVPAVTVSGIPAGKTVTNSVAAAPGYIFAANGEAGVYIYQFRKSSVLNLNYCQGVTLTLLGRLSLDTDGSDLTYTNAELSANSVYYMNLVNVLNIVTAKLIVVASGNKGVSLINISNINVSLTDIDDF